MGITGTEVSKEAAAMILTDDNFATIVKAVELGRGLYDNLVKYIRFQMGVLAGMIVTFLGSSILNIASGIPFLPLQTLWVNFTTQVFQAVGLGYGEPSEGLMERRPRKPEKPILNRADTRWFIVAGLIMAIATMAIAAGAEHDQGEKLARTMAFTTFGLANLCFSFTARDALRSVFSLETFNDRTFLTTSLMSVAAIIFGTELQFFQRILDSVELTGNQWLICIGGRIADRRRLGGLEVLPSPPRCGHGAGRGSSGAGRRAAPRGLVLTLGAPWRRPRAERASGWPS